MVERRTILRVAYTGEKPELPQEQLDELLQGFGRLHKEVAGGGGSWGDVTDAVNERFGVDLNVENVLWLSHEARKKEE